MYLRVEAARLLIYQTAWLGQQGKSVLAEAAAAKLFTSEAWIQSSLDAIQLHGAYGYMKESGIERDLRDAVAGTIYSGTSEIQRVILARMLGLRVQVSKERKAKAEWPICCSIFWRTARCGHRAGRR